MPQIQLLKISNGWLVLSPPEITKDMQRQMSQVQLQEYAQKPVSHFCEDYAAVCEYIKRFFFDGKQIS